MLKEKKIIQNMYEENKRKKDRLIMRMHLGKDNVKKMKRIRKRRRREGEKKVKKR